MRTRSNGSAIIRCSAPGLTDQDVTATEQDNTPALAILTSTNAVTVAEGGTATFQVKLNTAAGQSHDGDGQSGQRGHGHHRAVGRFAGVRRLQLEYEPDGDALGGGRCGPGRTVRRSSGAARRRLADQDVTATEQDNTPALAIVTSTNAVTVPEGGTATFQVKLNTAPVNPTTVTVSRVSGDTDITVQSGASLVFNASNWNTNQTVTLSAASDADQVDGSAIIRCSAPGLADQDVTATEQDNTPALAIVTSTNAVTVAGRRYGDLRG